MHLVRGLVDGLQLIIVVVVATAAAAVVKKYKFIKAWPNGLDLNSFSLVVYW